MRRVDQLRLGQPERVLLLLIFIFQVLLRARSQSANVSDPLKWEVGAIAFFRARNPSSESNQSQETSGGAT